MEFKGTKGKWHVGEDYNVYDQDGFDIVEMSSPMRIRENWEQTGVRHWSEKKGISHVDTTDEEVLANARLIATAPEMLKVLQKFQELFLEYDMRPEDEMHEYFSQVDSVIAKALGKEQNNE